LPEAMVLTEIMTAAPRRLETEVHVVKRFVFALHKSLQCDRDITMAMRRAYLLVVWFA
jgi:hypothetical protein